MGCLCQQLPAISHATPFVTPCRRLEQGLEQKIAGAAAQAKAGAAAADASAAVAALRSGLERAEKASAETAAAVEVLRGDMRKQLESTQDAQAKLAEEAKKAAVAGAVAGAVSQAQERVAALERKLQDDIQEQMRVSGRGEFDGVRPGREGLRVMAGRGGVATSERRLGDCTLHQRLVYVTMVLCKGRMDTDVAAVGMPPQQPPQKRNLVATARRPVSK